jgi:hypothetical protein
MQRSAVLFPKKVDRLTVTLLAPPVSIAASPMALNVEPSRSQNRGRRVPSGLRIGQQGRS